MKTEINTVFYLSQNRNINLSYFKVLSRSQVKGEEMRTKSS